MSNLTCPNCGSGLSPQFAAAKMTTCPSCDTTLYLDGPQVRNAGTSGDMHDSPVLINVGQQIGARGQRLNILGHARFDYGRGWWDEFFATTSSGTEAWISVDEGDIILQYPVLDDMRPTFSSRPALGTTFAAGGEHFRVTERSEATCLAVRGTFPEIMRIGTTYTYVNCLGDQGHLMSGEFSSGVPDWYVGQWVDPFELRVEGAA